MSVSHVINILILYARTGKSREENVEVDTCCSKPTTGRNVPGTSESQIAENGVSVNLGGENFENGGERKELL